MRNLFNYGDRIKFVKVVYYHFHPIPLPKPFKDGTSGMGKHAPEQGCIELYDSEGAYAHLSVGRSFVINVLPVILNGETKTYNEQRDTLYWKVRNSGFQSGQAVEVGQLDLMVLDILAQQMGKPLRRFLGVEKDWAAAYKGGDSLLLEDSELMEDMVHYMEEGYRTVKFKVGSDNGANTERDIRRLEKVGATVGVDIDMAVDVNQRWEMGGAWQSAQLVKPYHLAWFEEPIHSRDMSGIKRLKEMGITMPIAFGESMRTYYVYGTYVGKEVDRLQPSVGCMTRADDILKIRGLARKNQVRFSSSGRICLNAIFDCLCNGKEEIEYHEPISKPVGVHALFRLKERSDRFYCQPDVPGNSQRMDIEKLEKDGLLESRRIFYAE